MMYASPDRPVRIGRTTAVLLTSFLLVACAGGGNPGATTTPQATAPATTTPPVTVPPTASSPTATPSTARATAVYYMIDTRAGLRLARETRSLVGDPAVAAVVTMIAGPEDPDYSNPWNPATRVLGVTNEAGTIMVDLSADARTATVGSPGAALMIQQLVWTVTEVTDSTAEVQLLIEGQPAGELWGAVSWDEPIGRDDPVDVRLLVQIDNPGEGVSSSSPLPVAGEAAAFEATILWRVLDQAGTEVQSGHTMTGEAFTFSPYSFTVPLDPGTYTLEVFESDPSGGEGGEPMKDTKRITIS